MREKQDITKVSGTSESPYVQKVRRIKEATEALSRTARMHADGKASVTELCEAAEAYVLASRWPEVRFRPDEWGPF